MCSDLALVRFGDHVVNLSQIRHLYLDCEAGEYTIYFDFGIGANPEWDLVIFDEAAKEAYAFFNLSETQNQGGGQ